MDQKSNKREGEKDTPLSLFNTVVFGSSLVCWLVLPGVQRLERMQ